MIVCALNEHAFYSTEEWLFDLLRSWQGGKYWLPGVAVMQCNVPRQRPGLCEIDALVWTPKACVVIEVKGLNHAQSGVLDPRANSHWRIGGQLADLNTLKHAVNPMLQAKEYIFDVKTCMKKEGLPDWVNALVLLVTPHGSQVTNPKSKFDRGCDIVVANQRNPGTLRGYFRKLDSLPDRWTVDDVLKAFAVLQLDHCVPSRADLLNEGFRDHLEGRADTEQVPRSSTMNDNSSYATPTGLLGHSRALAESPWEPEDFQPKPKTTKVREVAGSGYVSPLHKEQVTSSRGYEPSREMRSARTAYGFEQPQTTPAVNVGYGIPPVHGRYSKRHRISRISARHLSVVAVVVLVASAVGYTVHAATSFKVDDYGAMCDSPHGFSEAARTSAGGVHPVYLSGDLGDFGPAGDTDVWRPKNPESVELVACMKYLGRGEQVETCYHPPSPISLLGDNLNLVRGNSQVSVYEAQTGRQVATTNIAGDNFSADVANVDPDPCRAAAHAPVDLPGQRHSRPSADQVHRFLDPLVLTPAASALMPAGATAGPP